MIEVVERGAESLRWDFHDSSAHVMVGMGKWGGRKVKVDPFPCYQHDGDLVRALAADLDTLFPIGAPVRLHILGYEELGRTNGWTQYDYDYEAEKVNGKYPPTFSIALNGRRVPLHPALTRYLVPHEYGHVVCRWIGHRRGVEEANQKELEIEYCRLRGLDADSLAKQYGGGTWAQDAGEIMVNDFRILLARREVEFWPHDGIARPEGNERIAEWWRTARLECAAPAAREGLVQEKC